MLAKDMVFKTLDTLSLYEINKNQYKSFPKYKAISMLEPRLFALVNKRFARYTTCINLAQARLLARDFILYYLSNYDELDSFKPLFKLGKKACEGKIFRKNDLVLLKDNEDAFCILYYYKIGREFSKSQVLPKDLDKFIAKYYPNV